jgi:hypothetical protein
VSASPRLGLTRAVESWRLAMPFRFAGTAFAALLWSVVCIATFTFERATLATVPA